MNNIRNFSIIAHIDHGKSTLADRFLERTGAISEREFKNQILDDMELERERGITIKARAVRLIYKPSVSFPKGFSPNEKAVGEQEYILNLIDTPGHVDFNYEVCKSLAACEGALLLVDASQGVEAQTIANLHLARQNHLTLIPIINKIDLENADIERTRGQIGSILKIGKTESDKIILVSAKQGKGIEDVFSAIIEQIPPPEGDPGKPFKALIFDSKFDIYQGVIVYVRILQGCLKPMTKVRFLATNKIYEVQNVGVFDPHPRNIESLNCGEVGFFSANVHNLEDVKIGDIAADPILSQGEQKTKLKETSPLVFSGFYPASEGDFLSLRQALEKLRLNDSSFVFQLDSSPSFGQGFRCGFLGLLHMEIIQERLEREFKIELISTSANVTYKIRKKNGEEIEVSNAAKFPLRNEIEEIREPYVKGFIITPSIYIGKIMELSQEQRGIYRSLEYLDEERVMLNYDFPLAEIIADFYDKIKSVSQGYASFDYEFKGYLKGRLVKLSILINGQPCDALSLIVPQVQARQKGLDLVTRLKKAIPKHLFEVVIQSAIDSQIIARETIKALKKNVTAKCYGGDISRKRKLWEKQKAGKKKMKQIGKVNIPSEAFRTVLKI
ncbi:MAG: translation elongation factor 4 [Candidatus Omnitrophica bacterium]|nr:translation elongation factor 4 [Candidatus Omnitrophota bacterium]